MVSGHAFGGWLSQKRVSLFVVLLAAGGKAFGTWRGKAVMMHCECIANLDLTF
jgi:hypothetical protein